VTVLLALSTVLAWGLWIPVAQIVPGVPQRSRTFYATLGNTVFAAIALVVGGGHLSFGWKPFWLPFAGGVVWTAGNYTAFRASENIGLARASGTWTPLNIITAFVWGAFLFGELDGLSAARFVVLGAGLVLVLVGVFFIVGSRELPVAAASVTVGAPAPADPPAPAGPIGPDGPPGADGPPRPCDSHPRRPGLSAVQSSHLHGLLFACAAGVLWGSYFVPAQWAKVPAQVGNFPLALGIVVAGTALVMSEGGPAKLSPRVTAVQLGAGLLFGIGNVSLLALVTRVGTGVGFTIAQLSLLVNVSIGIFVFKVPRPGSHAAKVALIGIMLAGIGGVAIGALK
jgi:glucose uptake protein